MKKIMLLAALFLLTAQMVFAQGMIIPRERPPGRIPMIVKTQTVDVVIRNQAAITTVEQVFLNRSNATVEGTYIFPVPKGASVTEFYLWIDGKKVKGELLKKEVAAKIYRDIVNRMKDPALLELTKFNLFKASIFPVPPRGERKIALKFSQALVPSGNMMAYEYPMKTRSKTIREPIGTFSLSMKVESSIPITSVYSPTHDVDITRKDDKHITIGFEKSAYLPETDLQIYLTLSNKDIGLSFAGFKEVAVEEGYFMMLLSPKVNLEEKKRAAKDVVFVLDTSGSMMTDNKISQAVNALKFGVSTLSDDDRFGLITFATTVNNFRDTLIPGSDINKTAAIKHLTGVSATGATNIHDSLKLAFSMFTDKSRPRYIIFLTDGLPTAVERNPVVIAKKAKTWADPGVRLFSWGVGYDVDAVLLDTLANNHNGSSEYVKPREEMELKMSQFFEKVSYPVMTDLALSFKGIKVRDFYPNNLPDLFKGSQLVLFGRFSGETKGEITLKGRIGNKEVAFSYPVKTNTIEDGEFIAHLWATRKVGFLLEEIRLHGENKEVKDEVIRLAKKYGLVTPYTSYLVTEPVADQPRPIRPTNGGVRRDATFSEEYKLQLDPTTGEAVRSKISSTRKVDEKVITITGEAPLVDVKGAGRSGKDAVDTSKKLSQIKEADKMEGEEKSTLRRVAGKTFELKDGIWIDSEYKEIMKKKKIKFGSDAYFTLFSSDKRMAKWLALGEELIIVWKNTAYVITTK